MWTYETELFHSELRHHGVKGMKWGIRRYQDYGQGGYNPKNKKLLKKYNRIVGKTDKISIYEKKRKGNFDIYDSNTKKVGQVIVDNYKNSSHIDWLGIKQKHRRKGYGKDALSIIIKDIKKNGKKYVTLDAAGLDSAAIHIYKKKRI